MKSSRHMAILKIIKENDVETQYDLARLLQENGYNVTQATVSRDIKELRRVYPDIPNSKLQELIEMNKKLYLEMRKEYE